MDHWTSDSSKEKAKDEETEWWTSGLSRLDMALDEVVTSKNVENSAHFGVLT